MMEIASGESPKLAPLPFPAMRPVRLILALLCGALTCLAAEPAKKPAAKADRKPKVTYAPQPWGTWVEPDFPFFSSVLDARREGP